MNSDWVVGDNTNNGIKGMKENLSAYFATSTAE